MMKKWMKYCITNNANQFIHKLLAVHFFTCECYMCIGIKKEFVLGSQVIGMSGVYCIENKHVLSSQIIGMSGVYWY